MAKGHGGFTLIEILVVLVIMSILATVAVLAIGDTARTSKIESIAERLSLVIPAAEQQAILQPAQIGLAFNDQGLGFYQYKINADTQEGYWQVLGGDNVFKFIDIPKYVIVKIALQQYADVDLTAYDAKIKPDILLLSSGDISAFTMTLSLKGEEHPRYIITGQQNGKIELTRVMKGAGSGS